MPISAALLLLSAATFVSLLAILGQAFIAVEASIEMGEDMSITDRLIVFAISVLPAPLLILPGQIHFGARHMQDLLQLKQQLERFSVRAAETTCCSVDHCHPFTGELLPCDRELIFHTLRRWDLQLQFEQHKDSEDRPDGREQYLDRFDLLVRSPPPSLLTTVGSGTPPFHYIAWMLAPSQLAQLPQILHLGLRGSRGWGLWQWMLDYCKFPAISFFAFATLVLCWRAGASFPRQMPRWTMVPILELGAVLLVLPFFMPYPLVRNNVEPSSLAPAVPLAFMWILVALTYTWLYRVRNPQCCGTPDVETAKGSANSA
ncbi:unnamed protein product [Symbiodinium necroappetens]|uniref:Uncharacterized protein n=1 Tax=Symbiodinium necroappetens TaxID=1628268 RepID=A0A812SWN8_9DINO|nr:unnamed protein product [Symbiodinium necroappetens]